MPALHNVIQPCPIRVRKRPGKYWTVPIFGAVVSMTKYADTVGASRDAE